MSQSPRFDASPEQLRRAGSVKWSQHPEAIGAFVAEMDFGTAPPVAAAMHGLIDEGLLGYLPDGLLARMSRAWAGYAREHYGWEVPPERVRPLADVISGLVAAIEHFSVPDSAVILPTPAYMPFLVVPPALGRKVIQVPMATDRGRPVLDLAAIEAAFEAGGNLLVLCNPHNPLGRVLEREEMAEVAAVVDRHGGRVFSDEIHAPLVYDGHRHVPYASVSEVAAGHTVTATSASKAWNLPGTKCAQLVLSNDTDAETWAEVGFMAEHGASNLGVVGQHRRLRGRRAVAGRGGRAPRRHAQAARRPPRRPDLPGSGTCRPRAPTWRGWTAARWGWATTRPTSSASGPGSR